MIVLNEDTVSIKDKLAFSNGLADSVKLGVLERMMDEHISKVKNIPSALIKGGKVELGRRETLSLTGELLSEHLAEKHGLKLEWGIIALIAVEVAFETFHLIEKLKIF